MYGKLTQLAQIPMNQPILGVNRPAVFTLPTKARI
jgi:hypothetical protein